MEVTLLGMLIDFREVQSAKVEFPIEVTLLGIVIEARE